MLGLLQLLLPTSPLVLFEAGCFLLRWPKAGSATVLLMGPLQSQVLLLVSTFSGPLVHCRLSLLSLTVALPVLTIAKPWSPLSISASPTSSLASLKVTSLKAASLCLYDKT